MLKKYMHSSVGFGAYKNSEYGLGGRLGGFPERYNSNFDQIYSNLERCTDDSVSTDMPASLAMMAYELIDSNRLSEAASRIAQLSNIVGNYQSVISRPEKQHLAPCAGNINAMISVLNSALADAHRSVAQPSSTSNSLPPMVAMPGSKLPQTSLVSQSNVLDTSQMLAIGAVIFGVLLILIFALKH